jgi:CTP:molybdopterin cytidylyltransferase MocA
MLILIPMAGHGDRYMRAGYNEPKPLIPVDGSPMIERVLEAFAPRAKGDRYVFVVNRDHAEGTALVAKVKELVPRFAPSSLRRTTFALTKTCL